MNKRQAASIRLGIDFALWGAHYSFLPNRLSKRAFLRTQQAGMTLRNAMTREELDRYYALSFGRGLATANYQGMVDIERAALKRLREKSLDSESTKA